MRDRSIQLFDGSLLVHITKTCIDFRAVGDNGNPDTEAALAKIHELSQYFIEHKVRFQCFHRNYGDVQRLDCIAIKFDAERRSRHRIRLAVGLEGRKVK